MKLMSYYLNFVKAFREQLEEDQERWKDEWKRRPIEATSGPTEKGWAIWDHQNQRVFERIEEYYMDWVEKGTPIPWLKVCGNAFIAWVREQNPETYRD